MTSSRALITPPAIFAIALLVLNDHVLKAQYGGWWTGKLSDVAGLAVFPLLLCAAIELGTGKSIGARGVAIAAVVTAIVFAAIKLTAAGTLYRHGLGVLQWPFVGGDAPRPVKLTQDPTDLLAIPAVAISVWLVFRYRALAVSRV